MEIIRDHNQLYWIQWYNDYKQVKGNPVIYEGFEDMDFFAHKVKNKYRVSEGITGLGLGRLCADEKDAAEAGQQVLEIHGADFIADSIYKAMCRGRISPRYIRWFTNEGN
jgi:hypothetical protein